MPSQALSAAVNTCATNQPAAMQRIRQAINDANAAVDVATATTLGNKLALITTKYASNQLDQVKAIDGSAAIASAIAAMNNINSQIARIMNPTSSTSDVTAAATSLAAASLPQRPEAKARGVQPP